MNTLYRMTKGPATEEWNLPLMGEEVPEITLYHGVNCQQIKNFTNKSLPISKEIAHDLLLPDFMQKYGVKFLSPGKYLLGPLVGIFINEEKLQALLSGKSDRIYRRFAQVLENNSGLAVFFSLKRVAINAGEVKGIVLQTRKGKRLWAETLLPLPAVIYDRCFGQNGKSESKLLREKCICYEKSIRIINALPKLGKIQIYNLCMQDHELKASLPRWDILNKENAEVLLPQYDSAYVKPDSLYKGKGVTKIARISKGYLVEQRHQTENYKHICSNVDEVLKDLEPYLEDFGHLVIQESIPLRKYNQHPFDLRLLLQKDKKGRWQQTGLAARIAGEDSIISSPRSGGSVEHFDTVMKGLSKESKRKILENMWRFSLKMANTIDEKIGLYAELGFDLGIDDTGKLWLIEINGKPLKVSIDRLKDHLITVKAYERPLQYAIYLAGFRSEKAEAERKN